jgi:hypothetical protein
MYFIHNLIILIVNKIFLIKIPGNPEFNTILAGSRRLLENYVPHIFITPVC